MVTEMKNKAGMKITRDHLVAWAFVLYFSMPFIKRCMRLVVPGFSNSAAIALTYLPLLVLLVLCRGRLRKWDFAILWGAVLLFLLLTYLVHPEYKYWYVREYYGVWDYVLRPDNGIYAYLFIRLMDDPHKILKYLLISAWVMLFHAGLDFADYLRLGYWNITWAGERIRASYNLEFGYDLLLYELVFLYSALKYKKPVHWVMAAIGAVMIIGGGSRGPVIDIAIFLAIYFLMSVSRSRKKAVLIGALVVLIPILYFGYLPILYAISRLMTKVGVSSRFVNMLMAGTLSDDNGRLEIWERAIQMIRDNPLGYGAMGSRHVIYSIIIVGHPHNIFLEILIDFGVIFGSAIILWGGLRIFRILRKKDLGEWQGIVMIFLGQTCQLLLSGTYWHRTCVWGLLAASVSIRNYEKRKRLTDEREQNG